MLKIVWAIVILTVLYVGHPLVVVPLAYVFGFILIRDREWKSPLFWILGAVAAGAYLLKIMLIPRGSYEGGKIYVLENILSILPALGSSASYQYLKAFVLASYKMLCITGVAVVAFYLVRRQFLTALYILISLLGYILLILVTYHEGESQIIHENNYFLFGIFIAIPLCYDLLKVPYRKVLLLLVAALLFLNTRSIYNAHVFFTERLGYIDRLAEEGRRMEEKKYLVSRKTVPWQIVWVDWAFAIESLLYTSLKGPDSSMTFYTYDNVEESRDFIFLPDLFLGLILSLTGASLPSLTALTSDCRR